MSVMTFLRPIGPTTWMATMSIRDRSRVHFNGTMTYKRRIWHGSAVWKQWSRAQSKPWRPSWFRRPKHAPPGSYEFARRKHIEMERIALRRQF